VRVDDALRASCSSSDDMGDRRDMMCCWLASLSSLSRRFLVSVQPRLRRPGDDGECGCINVCRRGECSGPMPSSPMPPPPPPPPLPLPLSVGKLMVGTTARNDDGLPAKVAPGSDAPSDTDEPSVGEAEADTSEELPVNEQALVECGELRRSMNERGRSRALAHDEIKSSPASSLLYHSCASISASIHLAIAFLVLQQIRNVRLVEFLVVTYAHAHADCRRSAPQRRTTTGPTEAIAILHTLKALGLPVSFSFAGSTRRESFKRIVSTGSVRYRSFRHIRVRQSQRQRD
jgi:hypothetical protein